jgi:REP element-mobilizing transposase RayT
VTDNVYSEPLAYLITFTTYGTRLHGDERGTVDPKNNKFEAPYIPADRLLEATRRDLLKEAPLTLDAAMRGAVDASLAQHCDYRGWRLMKRNVRTNHVHVVVSADDDPQRMMVQFKAYATRAMRDRELIIGRAKVWTEGGSKRWLFTPDALSAACDYVCNGQGPDLPMI